MNDLTLGGIIPSGSEQECVHISGNQQILRKLNDIEALLENLPKEIAKETAQRLNLLFLEYRNQYAEAASRSGGTQQSKRNSVGSCAE